MDDVQLFHKELKEVLAKISHEACGAFSSSIGHGAPAFWATLRDEEKQDMLSLVASAQEEGASPETIHEKWTNKQTARGWIHGDKFNWVYKTDPNMTEFKKLPKSRQVKYLIIHCLVRGLMPVF